MRHSDALYWIRRDLENVACRLTEQDYLSNDEQRLQKEVDKAAEKISRIEDLVCWLETNNYIEEEF